MGIIALLIWASGMGFFTLFMTINVAQTLIFYIHILRRDRFLLFVSTYLIRILEVFIHKNEYMILFNFLVVCE